MRVAMIAKVKNAGAALRFSIVDPQHAPALVGIEAAGIEAGCCSTKYWRFSGAITASVS